MKLKWHVLTRKIHRWGAVLVALPFLVVILTGLLLQLKKEITWIQPTTQKRAGRVPQLSFDQVLTILKTVPEASVTQWSDIDRIDVRPKDGIMKIQCKNKQEVQLDFTTGEVVQVAERNSDLIEALHDGSFFHEQAKLYLFLPAALIVLLLWCTGIYLFALPKWVKWRRAAATK